MISINHKSLTGLKFIDLFAGIGGFRIALESMGSQCIYSNEWDRYAQEVYANNFGHIPEGDITKVDEKLFQIMIFFVPDSHAKLFQLAEKN